MPTRKNQGKWSQMPLTVLLACLPLSAAQADPTSFSGLCALHTHPSTWSLFPSKPISTRSLKPEVGFLQLRRLSWWQPYSGLRVSHLLPHTASCSLHPHRRQLSVLQLAPPHPLCCGVDMKCSSQEAHLLWAWVPSHESLSGGVLEK